MGAAEPVLFHPEVARVMAFECNRCHGDGGAGGLDTRSHASLMAGGGLGKLLEPGNPDASLLVQMIEGRRGPERRMPLHAKPLPGPTISVIRQWIAEGARETGVAPRPVCLELAERPAGRAFTVRLYARGDLYARLIVSGGGRVLHRQEQAFRANQGETWTLRRGAGWPRRVRVTAELLYMAGEEAELAADGGLATRTAVACGQ